MAQVVPRSLPLQGHDGGERGAGLGGRRDLRRFAWHAGRSHLALRKANIYERQRYWHIVGLPVVLDQANGTIDVETPFLIVRIMRDGRMDVFATGCYRDKVKKDASGALRFAERITVCDSGRFDTLVAIPFEISHVGLLAPAEKHDNSSAIAASTMVVRRPCASELFARPSTRSGACDSHVLIESIRGQSPKFGTSRTPKDEVTTASLTGAHGFRLAVPN
jgi:hypothetical protein